MEHQLREYIKNNISGNSIDVPLYFEREHEERINGWFLTRIEAGTATDKLPKHCKGILTKYVNGNATALEEIFATDNNVPCKENENAIFAFADKVEKMELCENQFLRLLMIIKENFHCLENPESIELTINGENNFTPTLIKTQKDRIYIHINGHSSQESKTV